MIAQLLFRQYLVRQSQSCEVHSTCPDPAFGCACHHLYPSSSLPFVEPLYERMPKFQRCMSQETYVDLRITIFRNHCGLQVANAFGASLIEKFGHSALPWLLRVALESASFDC